MYTIEGFWHAAARRTGHIDLSMLERADAATWSPARLTAAGVDAPLALLGHPPLHAPYAALTLADHRYPDVLARVPFAPPVLFYQGNLGLLERPCVALVGSRSCTALGADMTRELARHLVSVGVVVVSGLAHGIDDVAHQSAGGMTIAVLGHALDVDPGSGRRKRMAAILEAGGLVLSEFVPGTTPTKYTFPLRNRVIAWLSRATVVVEAGLYSGALITARAALAGGRLLYAVPGHPRHPQGEGCLALIDEGAPMVRSGGELLRRLSLSIPPHAQGPAAGEGGGESAELLELVGSGAALEDLVRRSGQGVAWVVRQLAALELTGQVERLPGDRYARTMRRGPSSGVQ